MDSTRKNVSFAHAITLMSSFRYLHWQHRSLAWISFPNVFLINDFLFIFCRGYKNGNIQSLCQFYWKSNSSLSNSKYHTHTHTHITPIEIPKENDGWGDVYFVCFASNEAINWMSNASFDTFRPIIFKRISVINGTATFEQLLWFWRGNSLRKWNSNNQLVSNGDKKKNTEKRRIYLHLIQAVKSLIFDLDAHIIIFFIHYSVYEKDISFPHSCVHYNMLKKLR